MRTLSILLLFACSNGPRATNAAQPSPPSDAAPAASASEEDGDGLAAAPEASPAADAPAPPSDPRADVRAAMGGHDEIAELARAAIVSGDLPAFHRAVDVAAKGALPGDRPELGARYVAALRAAGETRDIPSAAAALGQVGQACAACHREHPAGRYPPSGYPDGDTEVSDRMLRHWWGVEAMWQGITTPSVRSWEVGVRALTSPDLDMTKGFPDNEAAQARAAQFLEVVRAAQGTPEARRGAAYGKVLAECAGCHAALGKGPELADPAPER